MTRGNQNSNELLLNSVARRFATRDTGTPISARALRRICAELKEIHDLGVEIGLVVGGGNIFRGLSGQKRGVDRTTGDYMGMLGTVINGLALHGFS